MTPSLFDCIEQAEPFRSILEHGKYSGWALRLTPETLLALLVAVGHFGTTYGVRHHDWVETFLERTDPHPRAAEAMQHLATLVTRGTLDWSMPSGWDESLPAGRPVFNPPFRDRLTEAADTAWAASLDARQCGLLLWNVGEIGLRPIHPAAVALPPSRDGDPEGQRGPSWGQIAPGFLDPLRCIDRIHAGEALDADAVRLTLRTDRPAP
jgi:hypothetical protein